MESVISPLQCRGLLHGLPMRSNRGVRRHISVLGAVGLAAATAVTSPGSADAAGDHDMKREQSGPSHRPGTPMLAVGSIAIDWALWKFIWTPFSEKMRRELSVQGRPPVGHDTPPEG